MPNTDGLVVSLPDRVPHDIGAERALLGAVLLSPGVFHLAQGEGFTKEHFFKEASRLIWDVFSYCDRAGSLDVTLVAGRLEELGKLERIGGVVWLLDLSASCPSIHNAKRYVETIMRHARSRALLLAGEQMRHAILSGENPDDAAAIVNRTFAEGQVDPASAEWASDTIDRLRPQFSARQKPDRFLPLESRVLRGMVGGIAKGHILLVVGLPGMGKSVFMDGLCVDLAVEHGISGCLFSLEMSLDAVTERRISRLASVNYGAVQDRQVTDEELFHVDQAMNRLDTAPLMTDEKLYTVHQLCARARAGQREHEWQWIGIDHLHEFRKTDPNMSPQAHMQEVADALHELCKTTKLAVILGAQMNSEARNRKDPRPRLGDVRYGKPVEEKAAVMLGIYRDHVINPSPERRFEVDINAAKSRFGTGGRCIMRWEGHFQRVVDTPIGF